MINRFQISAIVILINIITIAIYWFQSGIFELNVLWNSGINTTIATIVFVIFNSYLWRFPIFYPWLVEIPDLNGKWKVEDSEFEFIKRDSIQGILNTGNTNLISKEKIKDIYEKTKVKGSAVIDQNYSSFYLEIDWDDKCRTKFIEGVPLIVDRRNTKNYYSFRAVYNFINSRKEIKMRDSVMAFDLPKKLFQNSPNELIIYYSTHTEDKHHGIMKLKKTEKENCDNCK